MQKYLAAAVLAAVPALAAAAPQTYECTFTENSSYGWIPERGVYVIDETTGAASAYDGMIHYVHEAPIPAKFSAERNGKYRLSWTLSGLPAQGNRTVVASYAVRVDSGKSRATMSVRLHGADNDNRGTAACQRVQ